MNLILERPSEQNRHLEAHAKLLLGSYRYFTGHELTPPGPDAARELFQAPFFVASHSTANDPILTYGNLVALDLFEMNWEEFTNTPSRCTAEAPLREERARLLERVSKFGFIDDYSGIRISKSGRRFRIKQASVWNLIDEDKRVVGQAATFSEWTPID